jgi:hypothetical protein
MEKAVVVGVVRAFRFFALAKDYFAEEGIDLEFARANGNDEQSMDFLSNEYDNIMLWSVRRPHSWYEDLAPNILYLENARLGQTSGMYCDCEGYYSDSSIAKCGPRIYQQDEFEDVKRHLMDLFGYEWWQGGDNEGPIFVPLQRSIDAPCLFYFPSRVSGESPCITLVRLLAQHLPEGVPVIVRPHPKHMDDWNEIADDVYKEMRPEWKIDFSGLPATEVAMACRAVVSINSTLVTELMGLGVPVGVMGKGEFTGSGAVLDCSDFPERIGGILRFKPVKERCAAYLCSVLQNQLPYDSNPADVLGHPVVRKWVRRAKERSWDNGIRTTNALSAVHSFE